MSSIIDNYRAGKSNLQDAIRTLRTNIQFAGFNGKMQTIVITSVMPHEGKSSIALYLGIAMAEMGKETVVVDADCRRPMISNYLKQRPQKGLMDVMSNETDIDSAITATSQPGLYFLDTKTLANPVEVLSSKRFREVMKSLEERFDTIIIDTPPLFSFIEAAVLAQQADGTVLVIRPGQTEIKAAQEVVEQLNKANAKIIGVVLNGVPRNDSGYYYYNSYYYRNGRRKKKKRSTSIWTKLGFKKINFKKTGKRK